MDLSLRSIRKGVTAFSIFALIASMFVTINVANAAYGDVPADAWYAADVQWGLDNGILDSTQAYFRGGDNATRAEFSKMVAAAAGIPEAACDETLFPDVNASHWGCGWVTALADAGVVSGDTSGETAGYFRPNDNVLRAEAAKMAVEAFALTAPAGTLGSDYFTDSVVGQWYDEYIGIARYNCVFQGVAGGTTVEPGRNIVRAEGIAVVGRADNPTTDCVVVEEGALTVSLDGSSPSPADIPNNGANIAFAVFAFTASSEEDVRIDQLILTREGLGLPADFVSVKLYVDGVQKGSEKTVNTSTNTATFSLASDPIVVPAGSTVLVEVRADMAGRDNSQNSFCVDMASDVLAYGESSNVEVTVGGSFAVCGDYLTTTSASVGTLTYSVDDYAGDVNIGETGVSASKLMLDADNVEDIDVTRITLKQIGSADPEDFANPELYVSGVMVDAMASWEGDLLTFDLSDSPIYIERGNSKTVEMRIDVVGGLGSNFEFDVNRDWHIEGTGRVYNYGVNVVEGTVNAMATRDIIGGNLAFALSSNNPTVGDVARGAEDYTLMMFNVSTAGDGVTLEQLGVDVIYGGAVVNANELQDVKVWTKNASDQWVVVFGPLDPANCNAACLGALLPANTVSLTYTDTWDIPAATTQEFRVTADVENTAVNGAIYRVEVDTANVQAEYMADNLPVAAADISGGVLVGNNKTVALPTLTETLAAAPANQNTVGGKLDLEVANWDLAASSADDLTVTSITFTCTYLDIVAVPDGDDCADVFSNVKLFTKSGSTLTPLGGTKSFSSGVLIAANTYRSTVIFNSLGLSIPAGETKKLALKVDTSKSPEATESASFEILAAGDISAEDTRNPLTPATQINDDGLTRVVTFVGTGTLTVSVEGTTPSSAAFAGAKSKVEVAKLKLKTDNNEGVLLQKLRLRNDPLGALGCEADAFATNVYITDGTTEYASVLSGGVVVFNNAAYTIAKNTEKVLSVMVDTSSVGPGSAVSGTCSLLAPSLLNGTYASFEAPAALMDIKAVGESTGNALDGTGVAASVRGATGFDGGTAGVWGDDVYTGGINAFYIYKNIPRLTKNTTLQKTIGNVNLADDIFYFDIASEGEGSTTISRITMSVDGPCADAASYNLYNATDVGTAVTDVFADLDFINTDFVNDVGLDILAGTSQTYLLKVNASACTVDQTLAGTIASIEWTDGEGTTYTFPSGTSYGIKYVPLVGNSVKY